MVRYPEPVFPPPQPMVHPPAAMNTGGIADPNHVAYVGPCMHHVVDENHGNNQS